MREIINRLICFIIGHDWTNKAMKGVAPDSAEISNGLEGFYHYAKMYCGRCGVESEYNSRLKSIL